MKGRPTLCGCGHRHGLTEAHGPRAPIVEASTAGAAAVTAPQRRTLLAAFARARAAWGRDIAAVKEMPAGERAAATRAANKRLSDAMTGAVQRGWEDAYRVGYGSRGRGGPSRISPSVLAEIDRQKSFAASFAQDIASGKVGKKGHLGFAARANLYGNSVGGAYNFGAVDGGDRFEIITWRLGASDHCAQCPVISLNGPYTVDTLPTVPRAGATQCATNCKCWLEFTPGALKPNVPQPRDAAEEVLTPPASPPGLRVPTPTEEAIIRDLETRAVFAARKAAEAADAAERLRLVTARREASAKAAEYARGKGVYLPQGVPPDAVVTGADVPAARVDDLVRERGLDGPTLRKARRSVAGVTGEAAASLAGLYALLGAVAGMDDPADAEEAEGPMLREHAEGTPPPDRVVVTAVAHNLAATLKAHLAALEVLAEGDFMVEIGPYGDRWAELVAGMGTWIAGDGASVERFLTAWRKVVHTPGRLAVAPWRPRA